MKKQLLILALASGLISTSSRAQLALENFNGGVLPPNWALISDGHTVSTSFTGLTALQDSLDLHAWVPWAVISASNYSMLTTSKFTPAATADRWLITPSFLVSSANMVIQWDDYDLNSKEPVTVLVSPTAGVTAASFTSTIYHKPAATGSLTTHQVPIGSYLGTNIRIAFRDDTTNNWGLQLDNVQTTILPSIDMGVTSANLPPFVQTSSSNTVSGAVRNYGITTITSMNINYSLNGGAAVSTPLSSLSIPLGSSYNYTSATPWVPATAGTYLLRVWADNINGTGVDGNNANDTFKTTILVIDTLQPKRVMIEEFTQASCDPCANAHVNVDTVYENNLSRASMVRYHVNFPGRDCMDTVTLGPFVSARLSYYSVSGVPDAQVDGKYVYPGGGYFTTSVIGAANSFGSPFNISVSPTYNATTHTYSFSADIKSHGPVPAGLKAYAVLVVDTLTYALNQSTESIPQTVFPQVAEAMLPNSSGTTLGAFTTGSTQTITASWVKNHPWGSNFSVWKYDSTTSGRIIVFIENDATKYVYQAAEAFVSTVWSTGLNTVTSNVGSLDVYPNPASNTASVSLNLKANAFVKMEVYNVAGQLVHSVAGEERKAGLSISALDVSNYASGTYFVKVSVGGEVLTSKLSVIK